ncbi:hypothetical protein D5366_06975 [Neokomagataea tanensis]|uniref:Uncharacterized protein n=1 Tax=Neokomagataea tanensis TaxID=661191 RepID=A0A4Y6V9F1_9PROT|nr:MULTISPECIES: hypothetical protein [Neokomagataea]QDH24995.1 hypothetical protein D5366_06975 [Neokomagataea tanensis]
MGVWRGVFTALCLSITASSAVAAPCEYDVSPLPVVQGVIARLTDEGAVLRDGTMLVVPETLRSSLRSGRMVKARGLIDRAGHRVQVFALEGASVECATAANIARGPYPGSPQYDALIPETGKLNTGASPK